MLHDAARYFSSLGWMLMVFSALAQPRLFKGPLLALAAELAVHVGASEDSLLVAALLVGLVPRPAINVEGQTILLAIARHKL